ncbi:MAG: MBL fold metallo-hydrolase, partial [Bacteroidota bacterium]
NFQHQLTPVRLLNTHCHIDHVFGNKYVAETYQLELEIHEGELPVLNMLQATGNKYGVPVELSPAPARFLVPGESLTFGESKLDILFTPGHSPASVSFYNKAGGFVIAGDVLFRGSIGRTDLMGGDFNTLIQSIRSQLFPLGDDVIVYSGHGPQTTIGYERQSNPFLTQ